MTDFFIIDTRVDEIINCVNARDKESAERVLTHMREPEFLRVDANPPLAMLQRYRYWDERP